MGKASMTSKTFTEQNEIISGLQVIILFMLNSVEHEILNAHKYKDIKKFVF